MPGGQSDHISELVEQADIVRVAQTLGLQLDARKRQPRRAICPFHNDKDPSLHLYHRGRGQPQRDHYHCFVCGAHGDAIKLIQDYEHLTFMEAVERLAQIEGVSLPQRSAQPSRSIGLDAVSQLIDQSSSQDKTLQSYARQRGYDPSWLRQRGIGIANLDPLLNTAARDRAYEETLVAAGLASRTDIDPTAPQLFAGNLRPFFYNDRLLFPIERMDGRVVAFAARSLGDAKPKYLFSYGFKKSETLYRGASVKRAFETDHGSHKDIPIDLYVVEGVFDALRLEFFGQNAVAVLGSKISAHQVKAIGDLIASAANTKRDVRLHLLFDSDEAGWRGAYDATIALLKLLETSPPFGLDVVLLPHADGQKVDPDGAFFDATANEALAQIAAKRKSVLAFLAAYKFATDPTQSVDWNSITQLSRASAAREIALALNSNTPDRILISLFEEAQNDEELSSFGNLIGAYSDKGSSRRVASVAGLGGDQSDAYSLLMRASTIGHSSCSRREYPSDEAAWDRLNKAASSFYHLHSARLAAADGPSTPLLAREIPKGRDKYRRKSGLQAEDVLLQQYMLIELLRDRPECPEFAFHIPAVRYDMARPHGSSLYTTGASHGEQPVSFAYQIDMGIVNGEIPPRREGIFRPYFDCWRDFINFIEEKIKRFASSEMQILRLDIAGFYDNIRRDAIEDAVAKRLEAGLALLPASGDGPKAFAPLFKPEQSTSVDRAKAATKFLMDHSFGISHMDPKDGSETKGDRRKGIPQGPDLSAYLANIALFNIDGMVVAEINRLNNSHAQENKVCAAYARYVDDIVLVCSDIETASQLRRKIEAGLAVLGLSLNRKNPIPPPMSRDEARAWISDNRAGFGFSGPLADLPTTDAMDPLAEAGEIDRRTSLGMLHDAELDNPANLEISLETIQTALRATDLRFNDRASAYRRLWVYAADEQSSASVELIVDRFIAFLGRVEPQTLIAAPAAQRDLLTAVIEGLERALRLAPSTEVLPSHVRADVRARVDRITKAVLADIFTLISARLVGHDASTVWLNRYDVRMQIAIMARFAADRLSDGTNEHPSLSRLRKHIDPNARALLDSGLRWSLHRFDASIEGERPSLLVAGRNASSVAFERLHGAIVKLQRLAQYGGDADELSADLDQQSPEQLPILHAAVETLRIWNQGMASEEQGTAANRVECDAAATLVNLTYKRFAEIAARRPRLVALIAGRTHTTAVPSPPGLHFTGILLWCNDEDCLLLANADRALKYPDGVTWTQTTTGVQGIQLYQADLPKGCRPLINSDMEWSPSRIAATYRNFFPVWRALHEQAGERIPVPTVFSFFARTTESGGREDHRMICWSAPRSSVDGHAFVRNGDALEARTVFADGADYWRFGWALRDLCERKDVPEGDDWLDAHGATSLASPRHRGEALLTRVLPRLSGPDRFGPGQPAAGGIPTRIARGLGILEKFGQKTAADDAAYLVAAIAEGLFMSERLSALTPAGPNGTPAALLVRASRRTMRALPEAAVHWPRSVPDVEGGRHHVGAWFAVAAKIRERLATLEPSAAAALRTLAVGAEILGIVADLQSLAFELAGGLDRTAIELLAKAGFEQAWIRAFAGDDAILVEEEENPDTGVGRQTHRLAEIFCGIVLGQRASPRHLRDSITPAGWVVVVAILLQVIEVHQKPEGSRPALWKIDFAQRETAGTNLEELLRYLALPAPDNEGRDEWPWGIFAQLQSEQPGQVRKLLQNITSAASIAVTLVTTQFNPRSGDGSTARETIRLPDGTARGVHDWQVAIAYLRGERGTALEQYEEAARAIRYRYSIARADDRVLGVHLVSRQLARLAFGDALDSPMEASLQGVVSGVDAEDNPPSFAVPLTLSTATANEEAVKTENGKMTAKPSNDPVSSDATPNNEILDRIRNVQRGAWKKRASEGHHGARRVAIAQWDVTNTYDSPGYKEGGLEGLLNSDVTKKKAIDKGGAFVSTTEARRRIILQSILDTCYDFDVEGLVLPEYSVRPETVNWLSRRLSQGPKALTVWCGTFRIPGGTQLDVVEGAAEPYAKPMANVAATGRIPYDPHSALLTCLRAVADSDGSIKLSPRVRRKRYPSSAAGELIRPPINEPWTPLLADVSDTFDIGTYALELICSEIFPHASSANFLGVIAENEALAKRYDLPSSGVEAPFEYLTHDVYEFAKWTSHRSSQPVRNDKDGKLTRGSTLQRTLIILPAMTSRSADYHIFGQNQYLAAGLVTAFTNAVEPTYGCGQSCFIGLDGWQRDAGPPASPYGGIAPGVFQLNNKTAGPLGTKEAAIVIADLDLMRTTDQKPRPHYQERALRLVAHLPLIFETESQNGVKGDSNSSGRRIERRRNVDDTATIVSFKEAATLIERGLHADSACRSERAALDDEAANSETFDANMKLVEKALKVIAAFADDPYWLNKRRDAFTDKQSELPGVSPLPALVDWIYVQDGWTRKTSYSDKSPLSNDDPLLSVPRVFGKKPSQSL